MAFPAVEWLYWQPESVAQYESRQVCPGMAGADSPAPQPWIDFHQHQPVVAGVAQHLYGHRAAQPCQAESLPRKLLDLPVTESLGH